jgi:glycosyltransferase involved in cell wall biosynthesis
MRILIFHGYLLSGTGSNVYNARLAEALVRLGHEVHLFSQDRHPERQSFVSAHGDWDGGELEVTPLHRSQTAGRAGCTVYRPNLGGLLPVYVQDSYEGIEARTFADCTDAEIAAYVHANVEAVREIVRRVSPDVALANHLVMGPVILARALSGATPYAVKVHGSALEYTVKPEPQRFLGFAREGLASAGAVLVGSMHTAESLWRALDDPDLPRRTRLGPPGVDVARFAPREPREAARGLAELLERLRRCAPVSAEERTSAFARDHEQAAVALQRILAGRGELVAFVGKLIVSKGVDLLIAAWPLVLRSSPSARLVIVGFGAYRAALEELVGRLADGDLEGAREIARAGRSLEARGGGPATDAAGRVDVAGKVDPAGVHAARGVDAGRDGAAGRADAKAGDAVPLRHLLAFLDSLSGADADAYRLAARGLGERVVFTGRLDHEELADVLPACEALVVPSTFPEAFGMVAVEAAACGALPVSAHHSGLAEVSETIASELSPEPARWLSFPVDDDAVGAIAQRVSAWLQADRVVKSETRAALVSVARERWSWEGVARGVIAAARGEPAARPFG